MDAEMAERRLVLERLIDAPQELVFRAWTDPEQMRQWWGPRGWSIPSCEIDARPGGAFRYVMRSPEGDDHEVDGTISEIDPPHRIVLLNELGGDGRHPPVKVTTSVTFEPRPNGTLVIFDIIVRAIVSKLDAATEGMDEHTAEHFDRLGEYLDGLQAENSQ